MSIRFFMIPDGLPKTLPSGPIPPVTPNKPLSDTREDNRTNSQSSSGYRGDDSSWPACIFSKATVCVPGATRKPPGEK